MKKNLDFADNFKNEFNKRIYKYALDVVKFVDKIPRDTTSQVMAKQLIRSGTSVSANIIEAKAASSKKDYINFYLHALKSANESKLWIGLIKDSGKSAGTDANKLLDETTEIAKILGASVVTMKKKKRGEKIDFYNY
ncbi:four helix bundle protein [Candidatus Campbellbacteria bacterium CG10_big_fil_rev_8_21_14_0_10_35_52]|uniref:Four helix bundle protein n=1 Tax=Candidatus Campbellbacteria bacterium CG10_big_fil_rev_8_21_14_0_10_35_52 TaxID=1974527 RepID=A0A2M6WUW3_9BACT|nr:MAG: four helix bundle protein [Candidatus Campbellbacteria bacterium CG10_big_fil_rev_8_21_14_0_10_35_52]